MDGPDNRKIGMLAMDAGAAICESAAMSERRACVPVGACPPGGR